LHCLTQHQPWQVGQGHLCSHDCACANGFGQDQAVTRLRFPFGDNLLCDSGDGKPDGQFRADGCMSAHNVGSRRTKHLGRAGHDVGQHGGLQGFGKAGQGDLGKCDLRGCTHGPNVAQGVIGRDACHNEGIMGKAAQMVGCYNLKAARGAQNGGIIARAADNLSACWGGED
jgi:hypothetical protein